MLGIFFAIIKQYLKKFSIFRRKVRFLSNCGILNNNYYRPHIGGKENIDKNANFYECFG